MDSIKIFLLFLNFLRAYKYWTYLNTCCPVVSVKKKLTKGRRMNLKIPDHVLLKDCVPPQKVSLSDS